MESAHCHGVRGGVQTLDKHDLMAYDGNSKSTAVHFERDMDTDDSMKRVWGSLRSVEGLSCNAKNHERVG
jgi:hypothetical protein